MESDVGKLTAERGAIHRKADALEPFVHFDGILAHALTDDIEWDLEIGEGTAGDAREDGDDFVARELVASKIEAPAYEAVWVLEYAYGGGPYVRDGDLRELPRRRKR